MTTDEFAGKIKSKYPQYNNLSNQELASKMLTKYPQYQSQVDAPAQSQGAIQGPANSFIDNTLGKIPGVGGLVGGAAKGLVDPAAKMAEQGMQEGISPIGLNIPIGLKTILGQLQGPNKYMSSDQYGKATSQNPVQRITSTVGPQAETAANVATAFSAPEIAGAVRNIPSAIGKYGTKGLTWKTMEQSAKAGKDINWNNITKNALQTASKKTKSVQDAVKTLLAEETPVPKNASQIANPMLSSSQALDLRVGLGERLPQNFFEKAFTKTTSSERKAIDILRREVSSQLKDAAPGLKKADDMYTLYSRLHGDAPTWLKRAAIFEVSKFVKDNLGIKGPTSDVVDALGSILIGGGGKF